MQWIKAHMMVVVTSSLALLGVVMLILGIFMSDVSANMQSDQSVLSGLRVVHPVNGPVIDDIKRQYKKNVEKFQSARKELEKTGNHEPLMPDVFPAFEATNAPYAFNNRFQEKQLQLLDNMHAGEEPSQADVNREAEQLMDEKMKAEREKKLGVDPSAAKDRTPAAPAIRPSPRPTLMLNKKWDSMTPEERLREDPAARASMRRAHQIYCYAGPSNLDQRPAITKATGLPSVEEMWYAQMSLWIQQDVLGAVAQLNKRVADQLPVKEDRWVGNLPVKRLISITIGGYQSPAAAGGGAASSVFTKRSAGVDVIRFVMELVVDAQMLPTVIDELCKSGFYTPLNINYEAVSPTNDLVGFIYGSAPVIKMRIEMEGCFLRGKYSKWMPPTVAKAIEEGHAGTTGGGNNPPGGGMINPSAPPGGGGPSAPRPVRPKGPIG